MRSDREPLGRSDAMNDDRDEIYEKRFRNVRLREKNVVRFRKMLLSVWTRADERLAKTWPTQC